MSTAQWTFWRPSRGAPRQDPTHTEHFTQEELDGLTETLAREALQNSLDEPATPDGRVHVRFAFSERPLSAARAAAYLATLQPHLKACGLRHSDREPLPYLLIEDFGTRGLLGDPAQSDDDPAAAGNFYYFWRNIGRTNKRGAEGGTWGLGKAVYPAVSSLHAFFGLSVRDESPRSVLMGHALLKTHGAYSPYGWYGHADGDFVLPVCEAAAIEAFRADFGLRRSNETGLSLAVLKPEPDVTPEAIAGAVVRQYFLALVSGRLTVSVEFPGGRYDIDKGSVDRLAGSLAAGSNAASWLSLARAATNPGIVIPVVNRRPAGAPKWEHCEIVHDDAHDLRRRFERGEAIAFSVPVTVRPAGGVPVDSAMRVYLVKDTSGRRERPLFVRGGITIPRATEDRLVGARALGVVTDAPLAAFVRDSENPSHTEWRRDSTHFRGRYDLGASTLAFVKQAPAQLWSRLAGTEEERDPYSLADLFHIPERSDETAGPAPAVHSDAPDPEEAGEPASAKVQPLQIRRVNGGFVVAAHPNAESLPETVEIRAAYMVRDGARQALKRYDPLDFRLERMRLEVQGAEVEHCAGNRLVLARVGKHMRVEALGFDTLRDLVIRVAPLETDTDAASAAQERASDQ
jgi:hypothetical protein